jgi:hypothetical protein
MFWMERRVDLNLNDDKVGQYAVKSFTAYRRFKEG